MPSSENSCVVFKGRMMTLSVVEIRDTDMAAIEAAVTRQVKRSPGFFAHMPVLLSLSDVAVDLPALCQVLAAAELVVVGVLDADARTASAARAAGLGLMTSPARRGAEHNAGAEPRDKPRRERSRNTRKPATDTVAARNDNDSRKSPARVITQPVRSGQQIYARGGDLVITSAVSQGAEVLADGHIHVYGTLRGRALAGASGDTDARIFCRRFEPDLIAVAGCYKVADAIDEGLRGACVQVSLGHDNLLIELQE